MYGCGWMQAVSGVAGWANVGLCPASSLVRLVLNRWFRSCADSARHACVCNCEHTMCLDRPYNVIGATVSAD